MALLDFYDVSDQRRRDALMRLSEEVWQKGWWDGYSDAVYDSSFVDYVWLESRAHEIRSFDDTLLPGLLPSVGYVETQAGSIYVETPGVDKFAQAYDRLVDVALTPSKSLTLIESVSEELS